MRSPGMVHVFAGRSTSAQVARNVSDVRVAHRTVSSKPSLTGSLASDSRNAPMKTGTSAYGRAA